MTSVRSSGTSYLARSALAASPERFIIVCGLAGTSSRSPTRIPSQGDFAGLSRAPGAVAARQLADDQEADVVSRSLVFPAEVAQADHEPAIGGRRRCRLAAGNT